MGLKTFLITKAGPLITKYALAFAKVVKSEAYDLMIQLAVLEGFHVLYKKYSTFKLQKYELYKIRLGPSKPRKLTKEDAIKFYREMSTIRLMEQAAATLYSEKYIRGFCHLYSGQEAVAVGLHSILKPEDHVITASRCHGWTWLMGGDIDEIMAELLGKKSGIVRGKGGSMHMYAKHFYGGNGIVGAHVPIGVGVAFACKYTGSKGVCMILHGDGASNKGQVFESYNMSKLWNLPVVFVCENNLFGMGTSAKRASANTEFYKKGVYIPGIKVDGMDVLKMREVGTFAKDYALKNGPIIVEAVTYRYYGDSMSDPGTSYRNLNEIEEVRKNRDPIETFKNKIIKDKVVNEDELKELDEEIILSVKSAVTVAKTDVEVDATELTYDIYSNNLGGNVKNKLFWKPMEHKNISKSINLM